MTPLIYHYDEQGIYTYSELAELDPLEQKPLVPTWSTLLAPPPAVAGMAVVFSVGAWTYVVDDRGDWYDAAGSKSIIDKVGIAAPAGATRIAPPPTKKTAAEMWALISRRRDILTTTGGYKVSVAGVDKWFHSDVFSRSQQLGLVLLGANIPAGTKWKTMDKTFVDMTPALASQIFAAAVASDMTIFAAAEAHKAAMEASADPSAYDYLSSGWPVVFA